MPEQPTWEQQVAQQQAEEAKQRAVALEEHRAQVLARVEHDLREAKALLDRVGIPVTADAVFRVANTIETQLGEDGS